MKTQQTFYILLLIFISLISCSKEKSSNYIPVDRINPDTLTFDHSMKGWELYSWPNGNDWNYSILQGTNRTKSYEEVIRNPITVFGIDSLKMVLDKLPDNEEIFWISEGWLQRCWANYYGDLSIPDQQIILEIQDYCIQRNLILTISD